MSNSYKHLNEPQWNCCNRQNHLTDGKYGVFHIIYTLRQILIYHSPNYTIKYVKTPDIPESIFNTKYREYSDRLKVLTAEINKLELEHVKNYDTRKRMDKINEILGKKNLVIDELDSEILSTFIYKMISVSPNEIVC